MLSLIRFYFKTEPKDIDEFAKLWEDLVYALDFERDRFVGVHTGNIKKKRR